MINNSINNQFFKRKRHCLLKNFLLQKYNIYFCVVRRNQYEMLRNIKGKFGLSPKDVYNILCLLQKGVHCP
jgi:hypothetical protein